MQLPGIFQNGSQDMKRFSSENPDAPRPENFPLGSLESMVAARALSEGKKAATKPVWRIQFVSHRDVQAGKLCNPRLIRRCEIMGSITELWDCVDCSAKHHGKESN